MNSSFERYKIPIISLCIDKHGTIIRISTCRNPIWIWRCSTMKFGQRYHPFSNVPKLFRLIAFHKVSEPSAQAVRIPSEGLWTVSLRIARNWFSYAVHVYWTRSRRPMRNRRSFPSCFMLSVGLVSKYRIHILLQVFYLYNSTDHSLNNELGGRICQRSNEIISCFSICLEL